MIFYFIKFFQRAAHADEFMAGSLYLNTLKYFKEIEDKSDDGRADPTEAVSMWLQPQEIRLTINLPSVGTIDIPSSDLAGPVSISRSNYDHLHILCLYAVHMKGATCTDGKFYGSPDEAERMRREWQLDPRCLRFGRFAVVIPAQPFLDRFRTALGSVGLAGKGRLVEYYPEDTFHGEIPNEDVPFRKRMRFSYQREFRVCVASQLETTGALTINVGNLSSFCTKLESVRLPRQLMELKVEGKP